MEDISRKKPAFGRTPSRVIAGCLVAGVFAAAIGLSIPSAGNRSSGPTHALDRAGPGSDSPAPQSDARLAGSDSSPQPSNPDLAPDDEVDIALGGSWRNSDCTFVPVQVVKASTNELVEAMDCRRSSPRPTHAYEEYSNDALEALAWSDPIACLVLGRRLAVADPETSWDLMIRSSALLGGDPRPIRWLATHSFNQVTDNGEMATETIQLRYVLDAVTRRLEKRPDPSFDFREYHLRDALSDAEFAQLDRMVDSVLHRMKVIEAETTGSSTIIVGGAGS
jgi:hypothetical protein